MSTSSDGLVGLWGRAFLNLEPYLDLAKLESLDDEICYALAQVQTSYTGGSHKAMGIMPPSLAEDPYIDYGQVIRGFSKEEFATFVSLGREPEAFDAKQRHTYEFGEERDHPLTREQMLFLKFKHGVYFPWKVFYELVPGGYWSEKSTAQGKDFTREARLYFPRTVAFVRSLPFREIGRCTLLGLEANDHGTVHRDGEPEDQTAPDHFITVCPRGNKRLFLWDEQARRKLPVTGRAYWFNDFDYHGVEADPFFRYSLRVDGAFEPEFLERLRRDHAVPAGE
ncbi:hypothetical protein [Hyalangium versicolor]|uniref:hypothetical protein n=1 Tax=Hyalangium versicolor TaxID=2861190 RepID=UPI001CCC8FA4|nr:hypothetical protein [Hyalangium versicolor]